MVLTIWVIIQSLEIANDKIISDLIEYTHSVYNVFFL